MPSKKKTKKGPRKTANKADKNERGDNEEDAIISYVRPNQMVRASDLYIVVAVDSQMQRLKIKNEQAEEDALLEDAIKLAAAEKEELKAVETCNHGYSPPSSRENDRCVMFAATFMKTAFSSNVTVGLNAAMSSATEKKFPGVWKNAEKLKLIKSYFLSHGVEDILDGDIKVAQHLAFVANYLEQWVDIKLRRTEATLDAAKLVELIGADEHTLVRFYRKRIPCSCLDEKYEEVKTIKKMGFCCNPTCSHPGGTVERSTMLSCTRCRGVNYCSQECQTQDWKIHKKECDDTAARRAAIDSKR